MGVWQLIDWSNMNFIIGFVAGFIVAIALLVIISMCKVASDADGRIEAQLWEQATIADWGKGEDA